MNPAGFDDKLNKLPDAPLPAAQNRAWRIGLSVVLLVYVTVYGFLLAASDLRPFVIDANESYSTLLLASNLAHFSFAKSYGLADESLSNHEAGHPMVHSHQGNWPRVFGFFIYLLGARTIESQIAVTTLTIGLLAILLAYIFFARITSPLFASIFCILLMTDYVPFAQWNLVTYRVWHCFFVFSTLLCVHGLGGRRRKLWTLLTLLNYACLFYYEFVFVAMVTIFAGLYSVILYRRDLRRGVSALAVQAVGAVIGMAVLAGQLVLYLGWSGFLRDIRYTLRARNEAGVVNASILKEMVDFYERHDVAFWYNFADNTAFRGVNKFLTSISVHDLQYQTPFLTLLTLSLFAPWLIRSLAPEPRRLTAGGVGRFHLFAMLAFEAAVLAFVWLLTGVDPVSPHTSEPGTDLLVVLRFAVAIVCTALCVPALHWMRGGHWSRQGDIRASTMMLCALAMGLAALTVRWQPDFFSADHQRIWSELLKGWTSPVVNRIALFSTAFLGCAAITQDRSGRCDSGANELRHLLIYLGCGAVAYAVVYSLSAGYIFTGYLWRGMSLTVYWTLISVAVPVYLLLSDACPGFQNLKSIWNAPRRHAGPVVRWAWSLGLLFFIAGLWVSIQARWVRLLPPNHFAFFKKLREEPYRGATFVVNSYAAAVPAFTGAWALYDPVFKSGEASLSPEGYQARRDPTYTWFADRKTNPAYRKPDYYLCVVHQGPWSVLSSFDERLGLRRYQSCLDQEIIQQDLQQLPRPFRHRLVDWDKAGQQHNHLATWAIVKLDWEAPPYLKLPLGDGPRHPVMIQAREQRMASGIVAYEISYQYLYAQQEGVIERPPFVELLSFPISADCQERKPGKIIAIHSVGAALKLPGAFRGKVAIRLRPSSIHKEGAPFYSERITIDPGSAFHLKPCAAIRGPEPPLNLAATRPEPATIRVLWDQIPDADHYQVEMARNQGPFAIGGSRPNATPTLQVTGIVEDEIYRFRVRACSADKWCSEPSTEVAVATTRRAAVQ